MANNYLAIGNQLLPPASRMTITTMPFAAEYVSMNGIVGRDIRQIEATYVIALSWEALTPAEKIQTELAWETLMLTPTTFALYTHVQVGLYQAVLDEKSNEYSFTAYAGMRDGQPMGVLFDVSIFLRAVALIEGG